MSTELTPTSYVVLGLLDLAGRATPYDLKQRVNGSVGYFWTFPHSQLYAEPARLAERGLVREEREEGGRRRRFYEITDAGARALRDWLATPETAGMEIRDPGLLKLFFVDAGGPDDLATLAEAQREVHAERLEAYRELEAELTAGGDTSSRRSTLRLGLAIERAYLDFWSDLAADEDGAAKPPGGQT